MHHHNMIYESRQSVNSSEGYPTSVKPYFKGCSTYTRVI